MMIKSSYQSVSIINNLDAIGLYVKILAYYFVLYVLKDLLNRSSDRVLAYWKWHVANSIV